MRIAYLCADFGVPIYGTKGAAIHVRELTRALCSLGHEVLIVAARRGGEPPAGFDVPVHVFNLDGGEQRTRQLLLDDPHGGASVAREFRALLYSSLLRREALPLLREFQPDLVYERLSLLANAGGVLARALGVPLLVEVNAPVADEQAAHRGLTFADTARAIEHDVFAAADRLLAVSSELARWLQACGVDGSRISVLANGVDPVRFEGADRERDAVRASLGVAGKPVVGFLGTLKAWHDVELLIRACAVLHRRGRDVRLVVVGDGPQRGSLAERARSEGVMHLTTFTGSLPHELVPEYLAAFDVAVAPYRETEAFYFSPLKLYEYLAAARPVVAADIGEIGHCVVPGETGCLYPPGQLDALADALDALVADPGRAATMGRAGREHVRAHHRWDATARAVVDLARAATPVGEAA